jgi:hypothetical protein
VPRITWLSYPRYAWLTAATVALTTGCHDGTNPRTANNLTPPLGPGATPAYELTNPAPGGALFAGANLWNISWQGKEEYFKADTDFTTATDPWRPDLLDELAPYRVLRFMDWNETNAPSTAQASHTTRTLKTDPQDQSVALEWQVDLCNRLDTDCWFNFHHSSTEEDWILTARLLKTELKRSLRIYIEWSNETWNLAFPQNEYATDLARRNGLRGTDLAASGTVFASSRLFETFDREFADEPYRLIKVLAGQAAWDGVCLQHLRALSDPDINPHRVKPDVYAIAPYLYAESTNALREAIADSSNGILDNAKCAKRMGVPLISYESGTDSYSLGQDCPRVQQDREMRRLYSDFLDALAAAGVRGPFMQYTHSGFCWGLKLRTGDPEENSPKYMGLIDWLTRIQGNR